MLSRLAKLALAGLVIGFGLVQLVPAERTNPLPPGPMVAPPGVAAILRRACFDCHSNETRWPWYSHVAPASWLIVAHVARGRQELNFSEWGDYYPATRKRKLQWMGRALHDEAMPPWSYRLMHPAARLSEQDRLALEQWIETCLTPNQSKKGRQQNE